MGKHTWSSGDAYEPYVGRWSRLVAPEFIRWLAVSAGRRWLDVGCGTGALVGAILEGARPEGVVGVDRSPQIVSYARERVDDARAAFAVADARDLPEEAAFDAVVSGLVLNFVPGPERAVAEMARVARPGGTIAAYVWDYAEGMQMMRYFWDAAVALDPDARDVDEGRRFPMCGPDPLRELFASTGLADVEVRAIEVPTPFRDFDDYWRPFLSGQAPAPAYAMSLDAERREALRERIRAALPTDERGEHHLTDRAWAVRGVRRTARPSPLEDALP
jgi:SAM-dependent methyltransferase